MSNDFGGHDARPEPSYAPASAPHPAPPRTRAEGMEELIRTLSLLPGPTGQEDKKELTLVEAQHQFQEVGADGTEHHEHRDGD